MNDAYQQVYGVDGVPIAARGQGAETFSGVNYEETLFVNTEADKGVVHLAGLEITHQLRPDTPSLYQ